LLTAVAVVVAVAVLRSDMPEAAAQNTDSEGRPVAAEPAYSEAA
jgi:hypothetical protein